MAEKRVARALGWIFACAFAGACCVAGAQEEEPAPAEPETQPAASEPETVDTISVPQAAEAPPAGGDDAVQLDEITVTAQRRAESLQATPVSVSAFNAQKLEFRGIENVLDLGSQVPGMQIEPFPINIATLRIFIRGIGILDSQITQDPAVGVYLDGVYLGRSVGLAFDVADLERIEVLRGPQGTLYGRNTTGGAINLITRRPSTSEFTMTHKFMAGNRGYNAGRSMLNVPIADDLAAKLVVLSAHRKGYVENTGPGGDFGDRDDVSTRADLRWEALDWLTADYAFDYTDIEHYQYMYQAVLTPETDHGQAESFKRFAQSQTLYSHDRLDQMSSGTTMEPSRVRIKGHALNLTGALDWFELKYTGAQRELLDKAYADLSGGLDVSGGSGNPEYRLDPGFYDGAAADAANGGPTQLSWLRTYQKQTTHELQVLGDLWDDKIRYVAGIFLFEEEGFDDRINTVTHQFHTRVDANLNNRIVNLLRNQRNDIHNNSTAYFGQATWTPDWLEERLHLTLGYRHTVDEREALKNYESLIYLEDLTTGTAQDISSAAGTCPDPSANPGGTSGNDVFVNEFVSRRFSNDSVAGIIAYDLTPSINTYAKYVEAYKSGGFDVRDPQITGETVSSDCNTYNIGYRTGFGPEYVDSIEAGVKSEWLNRSLRVNVNLFNMDYTDRQISALLQGAIADTKTRNVGHSRIMGAELETMWAAAQGLLLSLEYEYLDAETLEVLDFQGNNVKDNYQPYSAPNNSYVASIDWTMMDRPWGALRSYVNYNYVDRRNGQTLPNRVGLTALGQYALLSARLGVEGLGFFERGRFDVALWGRNILDEKYESTAIDNLPQADRSVIWAEPRTYGADFIYRWH